MLNPHAAEYKPRISYQTFPTGCFAQNNPSQLVQPTNCPGRDFFIQHSTEIKDSLQSLNARIRNLEQRGEQTTTFIKDRLLALDLSFQHLKQSLGYPQTQHSPRGMATLAQTRKDIICVNANIHILSSHVTTLLNMLQPAFAPDFPYNLYHKDAPTPLMVLPPPYQQ
jgi:hypothetical protein